MIHLVCVQLLLFMLSFCLSLSFGQITDLRTSRSLPEEMILVEGGEFVMGNPAGLVQQSALPAHKVRVKSFALDRHEVTVAQYREFCKATARQIPAQPRFSGEDHPVVNVTWSEAKAYAEWKGNRLPTEAEWEYAARGGNRSKGFMYSGSDSLGEVGWYLDNSGEQTHPVGKKKPNELGIYDMSGNAFEWCSDWFSEDYHSQSPVNDPPGPATGEAKVLRGGCWYDGHHVATRVASRAFFDPQDTFMYIGFRCARDVAKME